MYTVVAVTSGSTTVPFANTAMPTHTLANDRLVMSFSTNTVVVATSTVKTLPFSAVSVKVPAAPDVPHVPAVVVPFTAVTIPNSPVGAGGGGGGGATKTFVAVTVESVRSPLSNADIPTQTLANDGAV